MFTIGIHFIQPLTYHQKFQPSHQDTVLTVNVSSNHKCVQG